MPKRQRPEENPPVPQWPGLPNPVRLSDFCQRARLSDAAEFTRLGPVTDA